MLPGGRSWHRTVRLWSSSIHVHSFVVIGGGEGVRHGIEVMGRLKVGDVPRVFGGIHHSLQRESKYPCWIHISHGMVQVGSDKRIGFGEFVIYHEGE